MNYIGEPFTHIYEWKRRYPSFGFSGSFFWIFAVAIVVLGSTSMIYFPFPFPLPGSGSRSKHASALEAFNFPTSDYLV